MKNKELIDSAFKEINDATDWHLISNLTFDLTDSIEKEYLFKEAEKIFIEKECAEEFMSLTRWAINNKLSISEEYSGMHLADKAWGMSILEQVKEKVDDKTYKKVVKGTKQLLIG